MDTNVFIDTEPVKQFLEDYREAERELDGQYERIASLEAKMDGLGAQIITDMPRATSHSNDRLETLLDAKEELKQEIDRLQRLQNRRKVIIEEALRKMKKADERTVIRMRYLDGSSWNEINEMLFGARIDFEERRETFLRRIHRYREYALVDISLFFEGKEFPVMEDDI